MQSNKGQIIPIAFTRFYMTLQDYACVTSNKYLGRDSKWILQPSRVLKYFYTFVQQINLDGRHSLICNFHTAK